MKTGIPEDSALKSQLWWTLALVVATAILLGRRGFVHHVEQGKTASQIFSLRARCLPYITLWAVLAILAVVLAFFQDISECISVAGLVFGEFVAVCLWQHYFENNDFVLQYVKENKKRLRYLLTHGMGMNDVEFQKFCHAVEADQVEFWRTHLGNRKWSRVNREELGKLLFDSGIESGRTMTRTLWEGALFDVEAFMREWLKGIKHVRVPERLAEPMQRGGNSNDQALSCVGIILANETREVREARKKDGAKHAVGQFCASRIAMRKAAAEGILHWPNCLSQVDEIEILDDIQWNTEELYVLDKGIRLPCSQEKIPFSVLYSLRAIIEAGYLRISPEGTINAEVTFKYANMVFKKDEWNPLRTIERKPFRYITSATWMSGDPAFMVDQRETSEEKAQLDGSGYLDGVLKLKANVDVKKAEWTWLEQANIQQSEAEIWGKTEDFIQPKGVCFLNWPTLWAIKALWFIFGLIVRFRNLLTNVQQPSGRTRDSTTVNPSDSLEHETSGHVLFDEGKRAMRSFIHRKEADEIREKCNSPPDCTITLLGDVPEQD